MARWTSRHRRTGRAGLDGDLASDYCIIKNGQKLVQEGDVLPGFSANPLGSPTAAPIYLANSGDLFWMARSTSPDDDAFLRNEQVIVQRNRSMVAGQLVTHIQLGDNAFHVSPDGRFFTGRIELQGVGEALILADFGLVVPLPGCHGNPGRLRKAGGDARVGMRLLELDRGQAQGVLPVVFIGTNPARPGSDCGLRVGAGELLVQPASVIATLVGAPWNGTPTPIDIDIPADIALVDREFFVQGAFVNSRPSPARALLLTNGRRLEIGAP